MTAAAPDRFVAARAVADAVLYEGYVLYPYRASAPKNQVRWQFGVLAPPEFSAAAGGSERSSMRTECLLRPGPDARLHVRVRCLQVQHRSVEATGDGAEFFPVGTLEVDGQHHVDWDEVVDRAVDLPSLAARAPVGVGPGYEQVFRFPGATATEPIARPDGSVAGRLVRRCQPVVGRVRVDTEAGGGGASLVKVIVTVENVTGGAGHPGARQRDDALRSSLVAVHTMLAVDDGSFVSLLDPPAGAEQAAAACHSDGCYPVLIGAGDVVLSSPIILYDHPEVAPESPGDLYDATEIDEILALRVLTLTDDEKAEARGTDPRAAAIIDRCDGMAPEVWERLHGTLRPVQAAREAEVPWWDPTVDGSADPWNDSVRVGPVEVRTGSPVRLRPSRRADAQDLFLAGMSATVAGIFNDVDGRPFVAVTLDDDPATPELAWQGRYLFFHPDEIEPLPVEDSGR